MCTSCALVCSCTPGIDVYEGSMTQEPNSSHSLAPLGYPSDPKNHRESSSSLSFLERAVLTLSSPIQPLSALFSFSLALSASQFLTAPRCPPASFWPSYIVLRQRRRVRPYRELNGGFRKNGKSLRACQSDVRGFAPIWLMMIHCSISPRSRKREFVVPWPAGRPEHGAMKIVSAIVAVERISQDFESLESSGRPISRAFF